MTYEIVTVGRAGAERVYPWVAAEELAPGSVVHVGGRDWLVYELEQGNEQPRALAKLALPSSSPRSTRARRPTGRKPGGTSTRSRSTRSRTTCSSSAVSIRTNDPERIWLDTVEQRLREDLERLRADVEGDHDEIQEWEFRDGRVFVSVGSVADESDPDSGHGWLCRLLDSGALGVAGFSRVRKAQLLV